MIAVSDTGPLNYLILIGAADVLEVLFDQVLVPYEVSLELQHSRTPKTVATWVSNPPAWFRVVRGRTGINPEMNAFAYEEKLATADVACIELAQSIPACTLLMDDRLAKEVATALNVRTSGTLSILLAASHAGLLDFGDALTRLEKTTFRASAKIRAHYRQRWQNPAKAKP